MTTLNLQPEHYSAAIQLLHRISSQLKKSVVAAEQLVIYMLDSREQFGMEYTTFAYIDGVITIEKADDPFARKLANVFWHKLFALLQSDSPSHRMRALEMYSKVIMDEPMILRLVEAVEESEESVELKDSIVRLKNEYLSLKSRLTEKVFDYAVMSPKWTATQNEYIDHTSVRSAAQVALVSAINSQLMGKSAFTMEVQASLSRQRRALTAAYEHVMANPVRI